MAERGEKSLSRKQEPDDIQRKKKVVESVPQKLKAYGGEPNALAALAGSPMLAASMDEHAALLGDDRFSHPANSSQLANLAIELQQNYGNAYVQTIMERIQTEKGSGQALEPRVRSEMETAFKQDFSNVRVHNDARADELAEGLSAQAFTTGKDIFFREGAYQPSSEAGNELLGHELTHVVQQSKASRVLPVRMTESLESAETEAETMGQALVAGRDISVIPRSEVAGAIARQETGGATKAPEEVAKPGPEPTKKVVLEGKPPGKLCLITFQGKIVTVAEEDYLALKLEAVQKTRVLIKAARDFVVQMINIHLEHKKRQMGYMKMYIGLIADLLGLTWVPDITIWAKSILLLNKANKKLDDGDLAGAVNCQREAEMECSLALNVWHAYLKKTIAGGVKGAKTAKFISDLSFDIATAIATPAFVAGGLPPPLAAATIRAALAGIQNEAIQLSAMTLGLQEPEFNWEEMSGEVTETVVTTLAKELTKGLLKEIFVDKLLEVLRGAFGPAPSPTYEQVIQFLLTGPAQAKVKQAVKNVLEPYKGSKKYPELGPFVDEVAEESLKIGIKESFEDIYGLE